MLLKAVDLTTALRPSLVPDETLLFVQDAVGLYEGKYKLPNYQHGHAYLTSHRICYVDVKDPRKYSVAIDLKDVDRIEYQARFLRSSPKIIIYPKPLKGGRGPGQNAVVDSQQTRQASPGPGQANGRVQPQGGVSTSSSAPAVWICPICTFPNPVPSNFDPTVATSSTPVPPCLACGIAPPFATVLKAAISSATSRGITSSLAPPNPSSAADPTSTTGGLSGNDPLSQASASANGRVGCPRCTFANHPSLPTCEICGAALKSSAVGVERAESPAPFAAASAVGNLEIGENLKLSFRAGGEKTFYDRLNGALVQRRWLLHNAPPVPKAPVSGFLEAGSPSSGDGDRLTVRPRPGGVGIAGLERRGLETRQNNQAVIGNAFEDLEALMASAKEVIALAESFSTESGRTSQGASTEASTLISQSAAALGMATTKDMLRSGTGAEELYLSELSRNLAEYLTDDRKGILHREGGIMSLIDLWAVFNRSRNGVELVSPSDFKKAAELWEKLHLPVRLRKFKSGLLVVQRFDWNDDKTIQQLQTWLDRLRSEPPGDDVPWDWATYGRGVTAQEAAQTFGWSVGVATEELEMAEDRGVLCREEGIEGLKFWRNHLLS